MDKESLAIIVMVILVAGAVLVRRWYLNLPKTYKVSESQTGEFILTVTEHNPRFETATIELLLHYKNERSNEIEVLVEFLNSKREFERFSLAELSIEDIDISHSSQNKQFSCSFEKRDLMRGIRLKEIELYRFRFVMQVNKTTIIKSPEFAFSSKSMLFRPDTGRYN
ncbi:MAG: hypothetical protein Q8S18_04675 [Bacteroidales bacterium]|nr:hypothetical protein [Bacteroidales bacterium]